MAGRKRDDLIAMGQKKTVGAHQERSNPLLNKIRKRRLDLARATYIHKQQAYTETTRSDLHLSGFVLGKNGVGRVAEVSNRRGSRRQFEQHLKPLCGHFDSKEDDA